MSGRMSRNKGKAGERELWADFPTADVEADTARMNRWVEEVIRSMPEQYYWVHRRFKTRPEGEPRPY